MMRTFIFGKNNLAMSNLNKVNNTKIILTGIQAIGNELCTKQKVEK